jgi:hypothetical protein
MAGHERWQDTAETAWGWVVDQVQWDTDGRPWLPMTIPDEGVGEPDEYPVCLHSGIGGLAFALAEIELTRPWTDTERQLADGIVAAVLADVPGKTEPCYGLGLAGDAVALRLLDRGSESAALDRLVDLAHPTGWPSTVFGDYQGPVTDLLLGNAGVALTAMWIESSQSDRIATTAAGAVAAVAENVEPGLRWMMYPGYEAEMPNYSHGTSGVVAALASAGGRLGRRDWIEMAVQGAEHVIAVADEGGRSDLGLRVPHAIPHLERYDMDLYTWNWCHGPAGTSYAFLALAEAGVTEVAGRTPLEWHAHCLRALDTSGIPDRREPGFWDNDGRCCGTAGSADAYLDGAQARRDDTRLAAHWLERAAFLADTLVERAITDESGTRWRFIEHRIDPPLLPPGTGWMQGAAGIAAYLFRAGRVVGDGLDAPRVTRPDAMWG